MSKVAVSQLSSGQLYSTGDSYWIKFVVVICTVNQAPNVAAQTFSDECEHAFLYENHSYKLVCDNVLTG